MKIFVDTNVLIDLICQREGYDQAGKILALGEFSQYTLYTSVLSIANIANITEIELAIVSVGFEKNGSVK